MADAITPPAEPTIPAGGLCSLEDVLARLGITAGASDARILSDIVAVSDLLREETGLRLVETADGSKTFNVFEKPTVFPRELATVTSVTKADGSAIAHTVVLNEDGTAVSWITLDDGSYTGQVIITGSWGWDAIPPLLVTACAMTAADWYKRDQSVTATPLGDIGFDTTRRSRALPPYVVEMIEGFCQKRF